MKHKESIAFATKALLTLAALSACSVALAQSANEKPKNCVGYQEDLIYAAKISGPHLERIKSVTFHFDRAEHEQQTKLKTWIEIREVTPRPGDALGLFRTTFAVRGDVASGEYTLSLIEINGNGATQPVQGSALPSASFKVCAPEEFGPYKVDAVEGKH